MEGSEVLRYMKEYCLDEDVVAVAAIKAMIKFIQEDGGKIRTMQEMRETLIVAQEQMAADKNSIASIRSACELFIRFITLTILDYDDFEECR